MRLFTLTEQALKINLHTHTSQSDGKLPPAEALKVYEEAGYDAVCLTDHRMVTEAASYKGGMLILPGVEWDAQLDRGGETIHLLGIGVKEELPKTRRDIKGTQGFIDVVGEKGGLVYLCHPHWSMNRVETIAGLKGLQGAEIFNSVSRPPYNADRADSTYVLDLAASEGCLLPTIATDDTHHYDKELFGGFFYLNAHKDMPGVMEAMRRGDYHASQGPRILSADYQDGVVSVRTSPVRHITFHSNLPWTPGRCVSGEGITRGSYHVRKESGERFIRVIIEDRNGRKAWLNPFKL
ncbi:MAG: hypothetical protein PHP02_07405 [Eubacteriales bacterium]|nr:hypothetical protein [Eubacteriales bacterium]